MRANAGLQSTVRVSYSGGTTGWQINPATVLVKHEGAVGVLEYITAMSI